MGTIYDTTNHIDTTMSRKSKLTKNFFGDNYWIQGLQDKIDAAWAFSTDRVDIKEEIQHIDENGYVDPHTEYDDIEVRITSAYDETGQKLSQDFKSIIFKQVEHDLRLGRKYKFALDDYNFGTDNQQSVWLDINHDSIKLGANAIVRRCTANLGFLVEGKTTEWYEPAVIEYNPKYTMVHNNDILNIVKSELYAIVSYNEYTKTIQVNDRFILGAIDFDNINNNNVYKVKEVMRFGALETNKPNTCPLIYIALDRDVINPEVDYIAQDDDGTLHYIANYYIEKKDKNTTEESMLEYYLKLLPNIDTIHQNDSQTYTCYLYHNDERMDDVTVNFSCSLSGTAQPGRYYQATIDNHSITIKNKYKYFKSNLVITCSVDSQYGINDLIFNVELGDSL